MLQNRVVHASMQGVHRERAVERGCPQGGVLSPLLWIMLLHEALTRLKDKCPSLVSQGFADDVSVLQRGIDLGGIVQRVQKGLDVLSSWCEEVDLAVLAEKSTAMLFTNKRRYTLGKLKLCGSVVPMVESSRYLGITLDSKLTWNPHCKAKVKKGFMALAQCRRAVGRTWGLCPAIMLWLYTAVVRPSLEYGAIVWVKATHNAELMRRLASVQRVALLSICGVMNSTPTAALECLLDIRPIDLRLREVAVRTMHRLKTAGGWTNWDGLGKLRSCKTHVRLCRQYAQNIPTLDLLVEKMVRLPPKTQFRTLIRSRKEWENCKDPRPTAGTLMCYTDGSKLDGGSTGSGFFIEDENGSVDEGILPLGTWPTVFQAEVYALLSAAKVIKLLGTDTHSREIHIHTDSLSSVEALTQSSYQTGLVGECRELLDELGTETNLSLIWIPAHRGYQGNEIADLLAKTASERRFLGPEPALPIPIHMAHEAVRQWAWGNHKDHWKRLDTCEQARQILDQPAEGNRKICCQLSRTDLRTLTQLVTGHCTLKGHLYKMGLTDDPTCDYCGREIEDRDHFICRCEAFCKKRLEILGAAFVEPKDLSEIPLRLILEFIKRSRRFEKATQGISSVQ
jgi:ribonuclease HI